MATGGEGKEGGRTKVLGGRHRYSVYVKLETAALWGFWVIMGYGWWLLVQHTGTTDRPMRASACRRGGGVKFVACCAGGT